MPSFSNVPPADARGVGLPIVRTPHMRNLRAIVTSSDLIGCFTHFWKGRTMPCEGQDCPAHQAGMPFRWHAWLGALLNRDGHHALFEMTAQAAEPFVQYREAHGTLRGCEFDAHRLNNAPNGRVHIVCRLRDCSTIKLPKEPNLIRCLSIIWNIAMPEIDVAGCLKGVPHVHIEDRRDLFTEPIDGNGRKPHNAA